MKRKKSFSNVCHSSQRPESKNTFTPNSKNKNDFYRKIGCYTFFILYLWAKYEPIWTNFTAQTVTLGVNLQNAKCALFFQPKVAFSEDIKILNKAKVFKI